jgi:simple sugar transport system ATP-binding protein
VGREVLFRIEDESTTRRGESIVDVGDLRAEDDRGVEALSGIDLGVHEGEIVGVAGVSGNGQRELAECLVGIRESTDGRIRVGDRDLTNQPPRAFVDAGVSYIPEDRYEFGCTPDRSVLANAALKDSRSFGRVFFDRSAARAHAERLVEEFDVRVPDVETPANKLSGGNLQKLICGRELSRDPAFLVASQPTRGVDVGAIEYIRQVLLDQRDEGTGILLISEDLDEVIEMSDRVVVLYEGEIVHETDAAAADRDRIGRYITGGRGAGEVDDASAGGAPETPPVAGEAES